jgi:hypothetical protein
VIDKDPEKLVLQIVEWIDEADKSTGRSEWYRRAVTGREFYRGIQWDEADKSLLEDAGRPALTINHVLPTVNFLEGFQRQNRKDITAKPTKNGTAAVAQALSALVKNVMDNGGNLAVSTCFHNGITTGKGWIRVKRVYDRDPISGELKVESVNPVLVWEDPNATEYDVSSARFIAVTEYMDKERCKAQWPKKAGDFATDTTLLSASSGQQGTNAAEISGYMFGPASDNEHGDILKNRYPVTECWFREWFLTKCIVDRKSGKIEPLQSKDDKDIAQTLTSMDAQRFVQKELLRPKLWKAMIVGRTLVDLVEDPLNGITDFPIVRFCAYFDEGYVFGVVDNIVCPQQEENKRRSQVLHNLNQTANSGYKVARLPDGDTELQQFGSKPGMVIPLDKYGGTVEKIEPSAISAGHMTLATMAAEDIREITGVANMMGYDSQQKESGRALGLRQSQGMTIQAAVFDNMDQTLLQLGNVLVEMIRGKDADGNAVFTDEEIAAVCEEENLTATVYRKKVMETLPQPPQPPTPEAAQIGASLAAAPEVQVLGQLQHQQRMEEYQKAMQVYAQTVEAAARELFLSDLRNMDAGRYQVAVSLSPTSPTQRMATFAEMVEINNAYPGIIGPEPLIKASDLANKEDVLQDIKQRQQAMQAAPPAMMARGAA